MFRFFLVGCAFFFKKKYRFERASEVDKSAVCKYNADHGSYGQPVAVQAPATSQANPVADPIHTDALISRIDNIALSTSDLRDMTSIRKISSLCTVTI